MACRPELQQLFAQADLLAGEVDESICADGAVEVALVPPEAQA